MLALEYRLCAAIGTAGGAGKTLACNKLADAALQLLGGGGNHARGNFFGTNL